MAKRSRTTARDAAPASDIKADTKTDSKTDTAKTASVDINTPVRFAVIGLGHIAQAAMLPAFRGARKKAELKALVSSDPEKLETLGDLYKVEARCDYDGLQELLESGDIDAVYIATPNSEHLRFVRQAAEAGVHVLCEKPLGVTVRECQAAIDVCRENGVKLMTAYRLHFEAANLHALEVVRSGKIGEPRVFNSVFSYVVTDEDNIRLDPSLGGGPLHDIGIYCINAARMLFESEPQSVFAFAAGAESDDGRFEGIHPTVSAVLRFPGDRLATFTCSFAAAEAGYAQILGTKGDVCLDPAFEYTEALNVTLTIGEKTREKRFRHRDQFAAELIYFAQCIRENTDPEPSGEEGLADVRVIRALQQSIHTGSPIDLTEAPRVRHADPAQRIDVRATRPGKLVNAQPASGEENSEDDEPASKNSHNHD